MEYRTSQYKIDISAGAKFSDLSAAHANSCDVAYLEPSAYSFNSVFSISVYTQQALIRRGVIGGYGGATIIHATAAVVSEDRLVLCCSDSVFCLSIPDLALLWKTQTDRATCFEIYRYGDDYIVHGETEISRLNRNGAIVWQQSGADIFVTQDGVDSFILNEDSIVVKDWNNDIYRFDYDGRLMEE